MRTRERGRRGTERWSEPRREMAVRKCLLGTRSHSWLHSSSGCLRETEPVKESTDRRGIRNPALAKELWQLKAAEGGRVGVPRGNGPWWAICAPPRPVHTDNPGWAQWAMKRGHEVGRRGYQGSGLWGVGGARRLILWNYFVYTYIYESLKEWNSNTGIRCGGKRK